MKKLISLLLVFVLAVIGVCRFDYVQPALAESVELDFQSLNDPELLAYVEESVYEGVIEGLDSDEYFVENVSVRYVSKEYLDEVAYNSQANIFFGYTLEELDEYFAGTPYVFALGEDGQTIVKEFEEYDDTYERVIRNVAIGTGVILVCVTVSVVSGGLGAPAVSMIFAVSAKTGTIVALSDGVISGVFAGAVKGWQTGDFDEALKAGALAASEGFMWGAIGGALSGGYSEFAGLRNTAYITKMSMDDVVRIQRDSKLPLEFICNFHSVDEYNVYKAANLVPKKVNGKWAYTQDIDWDFIGDAADGRTNAQRVKDGLAPLDMNGNPYELHHIGQKDDSPLAILSWDQHRGKENNLILHPKRDNSDINRSGFEKEKDEFWKALYELTK